MKKYILLVLLTFAVQSTFAASNYQGIGKESVSEADIKKYAPPPLDPEMSRKIQMMFDMRSPSAGMTSPDGKKLFFTWRVTGVSQIWRLDRPEGFPVQMTAGEDHTSLVDITPDGKKLIILRDRNGEENPGLYWQNVSGGPLHVVQHKPKVQTRYDFISADSRRIYFHANDIKPNSYAIYRHDLQTGETEKVFDEDGLWNIADHRGEDTLLLAKNVGSLRAEYSLLDMKTKKLTPVLGQNENEEYSAIFGNKPGEYLVVTPKFGEFRRLYLMKDGKFSPLTPEIKYDVSDISADDSRKHIYYSINEQGYTRIAALDGKTLKPAKMPKFTGADHVNVGGASRDGRFVSFAVDSTLAPRVTKVLDWNTGKLTQWTLPSAPEADLSNFVPVTLEFYPAEDGTKIPMLVLRSKRCEKELCPVLVDFHGGPEAQAQPYFNPIYQFFVANGYVVVEPNVRGSDGYGKSWINADNGAKRLNVITDIRDCANYIRSKWARDGKSPKIGVFGGSYGGYSTQVAMTMFAGSYDAGVSVVGMSNLVTFLNNTAPYRRILRINEYGDPEKDGEALRKLSPMTYLDQINAPMMLIQGLNDPRVPAGEAIQMHESMQKKNIPSQLVIFADEGHGASKRENQVKQYGYILEFFNKHLK